MAGGGGGGDFLFYLPVILPVIDYLVILCRFVASAWENMQTMKS
jgi:hypothetical protein